MTTRYLNPTNDIAFKTIFNDHDRLKDFLNAILPTEWSKIRTLSFLSQEELPAIHLGRRSIFDIKCTDESGKTYIIEMQNRSQDAFLNRAQCYASQAYAAQAIKGESHSCVMPVILLALTSSQIFEKDVPCISYHWNIEQKTKQCLLEGVSYIFIELPKFTKTADELEGVRDEWLYFFANWQHLKAPPSSIDDPLVLEAYNAIERFNWSDDAFDAYFRAQLATEGENITILNSYKKGKEEGKNDVALKMLAQGLDVETISRWTDLSVEDVRKLQKPVLT